MGQPLVQLAGVAVTYPSRPPVRAVRATDLTLGEGEYTAVVGRSGSGKSTLLDVLGLLRRPTAGRYTFDGLDTSRLRDAELSALRGRSIGFVFQSFHLLHHRTAHDNVMLAQLYRSTSGNKRRTAATWALDRVGLHDRAYATPAQMSGGERQRVAIARALVMRPRLLLCDEPTGNLDSHTATAVLEVIDKIRVDGLTVVMITHDPTVATRADRVITINDGKLSVKGPTGAVAASTLEKAR